MMFLMFLLMSEFLSPANFVDYGDIHWHKITIDTARKYSEEYIGESRQFFGQPWDVCQCEVGSSDKRAYVVFASDCNWNRVLGMKYVQGDDGMELDTVVSWGNSPSGPMLLRVPRGIDCRLSWWGDILLAIADSWNHRVVVLFWDSLLHVRSSVEIKDAGGFSLEYPSDVTFLTDSDLYLAVADGSRRIVVCLVDSVVHVYKRIGNPRFLASIGDILYVVDGKDRIVRLRWDDGALHWENEIIFPDAEFWGIGCNSYGVYALDRRNRRVLVLAPDLSRSYSVYGSDGEFGELVNLGVKSGDLVVIEKYTSSTGLRRFSCGYDSPPDDTPGKVVSVLIDEDSVKILWPDRSDESYFEVWRRYEGSRRWTCVDRVFDRSYCDRNVSRGRKYAYRVRGYKLDYYTAFSDTGVVVVPYLNPPKNMYAVGASEDSVKLAWVDDSNYEMEYRVEVLGEVVRLSGAPGRGNVLSELVFGVDSFIQYGLYGYDDLGRPSAVCSWYEVSIPHWSYDSSWVMYPGMGRFEWGDGGFMVGYGKDYRYWNGGVCPIVWGKSDDGKLWDSWYAGWHPLGGDGNTENTVDVGKCVSLVRGEGSSVEAGVLVQEGGSVGDSLVLYYRERENETWKKVLVEGFRGLKGSSLIHPNGIFIGDTLWVIGVKLYNGEGLFVFGDVDTSTVMDTNYHVSLVKCVCSGGFWEMEEVWSSVVVYTEELGDGPIPSIDRLGNGVCFAWWSDYLGDCMLRVGYYDGGGTVTDTVRRYDMGSVLGHPVVSRGPGDTIFVVWYSVDDSCVNLATVDVGSGDIWVEGVVRLVREEDDVLPVVDWSDGLCVVGWVSGDSVYCRWRYDEYGVWGGIVDLGNGRGVYVGVKGDSCGYAVARKRVIGEYDDTLWCMDVNVEEVLSWDKWAPRVSEFALPETIEVGGKRVARWSAKDESGIGVGKVYIYLEDQVLPEGAKGIGDAWGRWVEIGSSADGDGSCEIVIPDNLPAGDYDVKVVVYDRAGNFAEVMGSVYVAPLYCYGSDGVCSVGRKGDGLLVGYISNGRVLCAESTDVWVQRALGDGKWCKVVGDGVNAEVIWWDGRNVRYGGNVLGTGVLAVDAYGDGDGFVVGMVEVGEDADREVPYYVTVEGFDWDCNVVFCDTVDMVVEDALPLAGVDDMSVDIGVVKVDGSYHCVYDLFGGGVKHYYRGGDVVDVSDGGDAVCIGVSGARVDIFWRDDSLWKYCWWYDGDYSEASDFVGTPYPYKDWVISDGVLYESYRGGWREVRVIGEGAGEIGEVCVEEPYGYGLMVFHSGNWVRCEEIDLERVFVDMYGTGFSNTDQAVWYDGNWYGVVSTGDIYWIRDGEIKGLIGDGRMAGVCVDGDGILHVVCLSGDSLYYVSGGVGGWSAPFVVDDSSAYWIAPAIALGNESCYVFYVHNAGLQEREPSSKIARMNLVWRVYKFALGNVSGGVYEDVDSSFYDNPATPTYTCPCIEVLEDGIVAVAYDWIDPDWQKVYIRYAERYSDGWHVVELGEGREPSLDYASGWGVYVGYALGDEMWIWHHAHRLGGEDDIVGESVYVGIGDDIEMEFPYVEYSYDGDIYMREYYLNEQFEAVLSDPVNLSRNEYSLSGKVDVGWVYVDVFSGDRDVVSLWTEGCDEWWYLDSEVWVERTQLPEVYLNAGAEDEPYLLHRDGYIDFGDGALSSADYAQGALVYKIGGLLANTEYILGTGYYVPVLDERASYKGGRGDRGGSRRGLQRVIANGVRSEWFEIIPGEIYVRQDTVLSDSDGVVNIKIIRPGPDTAYCNVLWLDLVYREDEAIGGAMVGGTSKDVFEGLRLVGSNIFGGSALRFVYGVLRDEMVSVSVYDVSGRVVKVLYDGYCGHGLHYVEWDGKDGFSREVGSGVYFVRMEVGDRVYSRKVVLVKGGE